ncbi:cytochrome P450 [Phenylobacterium sp. LjRoot225]|uniref:cytochrome P450 n=1 Tax=Phenylobacterium sp. LjRoot225 TaxID=3342285 RepID=UPI003ED11967
MADDANRGPGAEAGSGMPIPAHIPPGLIFDYDDALGPSGLDDIYAPAWEVFEKLPPVFYAPARHAGARWPGSWVCTRYDDVREVFQNTDRYSSEAIFPFLIMIGETFRALPPQADPPEHDKYRILMNPWFSPKAVAQIDANIQAVVGQLIDGFADKGECDVSHDFGRIYPVRVFMRLMGFPEQRFEDFLSWGYAMLHDMTDLEQMRWGAKSGLAYLRSFVEEVRRTPGDNLTSRIVHGQVEGRPLTEDEIMGIVFFLWVGGLDTVAATSSLMFRRLALDPELQQTLRDNPQLHADAVEEFLRMSPTVNSSRMAKADHELHGVKIRKGEMVQCLVATANYDPAEFEDPRSFRLDRSSNRHLTFIAGPHRCLGSHLARRELRIALSEVLRRLPAFRIKPGADRTAVPGLVAMKRLPIVWEASAP